MSATFFGLSAFADCADNLEEIHSITRLNATNWVEDYSHKSARENDHRPLHMTFSERDNHLFLSLDKPAANGTFVQWAAGEVTVCTHGGVTSFQIHSQMAPGSNAPFFVQVGVHPNMVMNFEVPNQNSISLEVSGHPIAFNPR